MLPPGESIVSNSHCASWTEKLVVVVVWVTALDVVVCFLAPLAHNILVFFLTCTYCNLHCICDIVDYATTWDWVNTVNPLFTQSHVLT